LQVFATLKTPYDAGPTGIIEFKTAISAIIFCNFAKTYKFNSMRQVFYKNIHPIDIVWIVLEITLF